MMIDQKTKLNIWQICLIILLVLGIFFRFAHLDRKVYWLDESHTSLRIFGYTEPEFIQDIFAGEVVNSEDLLKYQGFSPEKNWSDTFRVVSGNTEHAPLYYFSLRLWAQWFGSSVTAIRSFSAILSLLAFPCLYWLCQELFASPAVSWMAIALFSVSPFQILYAQEARPYSLLTLTILLATASLLRAIRLNNQTSWALYTLTLTLGCYTHWFFVLIALSHGIYLVTLEKFRPTKTAISYLITSLTAIIAFSPWIVNTLLAPPPLEQQMGWVFRKLPLLTLVKSWGLSISRVFFDLDRGLCLPPGNPNCRYFLSSQGGMIYLVIIPLIILLVYSFYLLFRRTPQRVWLLLISLMAVTALALIVPDLIKGGQRSTVTRYLIPCLLAMQIAVAYSLSTHLINPQQKIGQQKLWQVITVILISLGVISSVVSFSATGWWSKGKNYHVYPIANYINQSDRPLLLYSVPNNVLWGKGGAVGRVMPLSRILEPKVGILFAINGNDPPEKLPTGYEDVFLYRPSRGLKQWLEENQNQKVELVKDIPNNNSRLWKLTLEE